MANSFIAVHKSKGIEYASVCTPARVNGKKVNNQVYLGRVINLEEGRFRSKARGEFFYSLENGFSYPTSEPESRIKAAMAKGSLVFGNVFCTHTLLERTGLLNLFTETEKSSPDTLLALLMHRLIENYADSQASSFLEQTYASLLYPAADLSSQNIIRYLTILGSEAVREDFLRRYSNMMYSDDSAVGILINNAVLLNDIGLPKLALGSQEGSAEKQMRLIYAVERETFSPIYYKNIAGNVVDIVTLKETIAEMKSMNVKIGYSVLDAGYNSESNLEELYSLGIDFMAKLSSDSGLYKRLLAKTCHTVMHPSNRIVYNKRLLFMTRNKVELNKRNAYAYIGVDDAKRHEVIRELYLQENPKKPMSDEEFDMKTKTAGMFVMISSIEMHNSEVLPYYYSQQTIEQIFDTGKNFAKLLPLSGQSQQALNGHLLLSFITTIVYLKLQEIFHKEKYKAIDFITELKGITCGVYDDHLQIY
jgi:hypothetical protein